jgi:hypothetical protein
VKEGGKKKSPVWWLFVCFLFACFARWFVVHLCGSDAYVFVCVWVCAAGRRRDQRRGTLHDWQCFQCCV